MNKRNPAASIVSRYDAIDKEMYKLNIGPGKYDILSNL